MIATHSSFVPTMEELTNIQNFYKDQTIFLTGGTGFIGKVLIEKLLRVCYNLNAIYILVRPKRDKTADQRIQEIFDYPCFDGLKSKMPNFREKIRLINGNCDEPGLGLSQQNINILKMEVNIVIHAAANVKFDQDLRSAACSNIRAVRDILELAKQMTRLKAFVHVSTAYSNSPQSHIKEQFYQPGMKEKNLFALLDAVDDETLNSMTADIIKKWPNAYAFTKSIAEDLIKTEGKTLPIDSYFISTADDPMPGWIDNFYGLIGLETGIGLGAIKSIYSKKNIPCHCVPCDYVANTIIAVTWDLCNGRSTKKEQEGHNIPIYNYTGSETNAVTMRDLQKYFDKYKWRYPTNLMFWFPIFSYTDNIYYYKIRTFFLHTVMSYIIDFCLICLRKKPIAVKKFRQINCILEMTAYFSTPWKFDHNGVEQMWQKMTEDDRKLFKFNMDDLDWNKYFAQGIKSIRVYLLNDPFETLPKAKRRMLLLAILHYTVVLTFYYLFLKLILSLVFL